MRVISGEFRGLKLASPVGMETRPTLDRVKEAVFSMLMPYINGSVVLDLFAGSGALGIEALSRGADLAVFVDNNGKAIDCLRQNISVVRAESKAFVLKENALSYIEHCDRKFDLIFLDPPYSEGLYDKVIKGIAANDLLTEDGLLVVEWDSENGISFLYDNMTVVKEKKYGRVCITVLKRG